MMDLAPSGAPYRPYVVKPVPQIPQGNMAMKVMGNKTGHIKGDLTKNRFGNPTTDWIELSHFQCACVSPRDPQSGLPTGQRLHQGVEVVGRNCQGVPLLWTAAWTHEDLTEVEIRYFTVQNQIGGVGDNVVNSFICKMTNAQIQSIDHMCSYKDGTLYFRLRFVYGAIEFTWPNGNISVVDRWLQGYGS